jgi:ABC-2 type transport system ATP-binding protein
VTWAISTRALTKRYGNRVAVDAIDCDVPAGVIAGFVGPNGSGKTTTIRMLLSFIAPTSGTAEVLGVPITRPGDYLPHVGALIEGPSFYWWLSGRRNLEVLAALDGTPATRVAEVLATVGLEDRAEDAVRGYSLGMKQRLGIAAALLSRPRLLILDEPANGLDPAGIHEMRSLLGHLRDDGVTVFISSHILSELEQLADWILVIKAGKLLFQGSVGELLQRRRTTLLILVPENRDQGDALVAILRRHEYSAHNDDRGVRISDLVGPVSRVIRLAMEADIPLAEVTPLRSSLEDTFIAMTDVVAP